MMTSSLLPADPATDTTAPATLTVAPRRPFSPLYPHGYLESDRDYVDNNLEAAVALLDAAQVWPAQLTGAPATIAPGFYWYLRKAAPAIVVEKREGEAFVRLTNGTHQTWLGEGEAFMGPLQAPTQAPVLASLA